MLRLQPDNGENPGSPPTRDPRLTERKVGGRVAGIDEEQLGGSLPPRTSHHRCSWRAAVVRRALNGCAQSKATQDDMHGVGGENSILLVVLQGFV